MGLVRELNFQPSYRKSIDNLTSEKIKNNSTLY